MRTLLLALLCCAGLAAQELSVLRPGERVAFTAVTKDQFGHDMDADDLIGWIASGGELDRSSGARVVYTAGAQPGEWMVTANRAGLMARRRIRIVAAEPEAEARSAAAAVEVLASTVSRHE